MNASMAARLALLIVILIFCGLAQNKWVDNTEQGVYIDDRVRESREALHNLQR